MKTFFKFRFATFAFAVATLATLFFASCQKERLDPSEAMVPQVEEEQALFSKEVTVTDASGKNTAIVRFSSESSSLLEDADLSKLFRLEPIFEIPSEPSNATPSPDGGRQGDKPSLFVEIVSQQLEPGAVGLNLVFDPKDNSELVDRGQYLTTFITSFDHIKVTVTQGCHSVYYYRKPTASSSYIFIVGYSNWCAYTVTQAWSVPSYRMKANIYYNSNTGFTITAW